MKNQFKCLLSAILAPIVALPMATTASANENPTLNCTVASDWTALFNRAGTKNGWLAADGIYSIAIDGNDAMGSATESTKTLFFFSDTILGSASASGKISYVGMANHSAALLTGNVADPANITFYYGEGGCNSTRGNLNLFNQSQWLLDCYYSGGYIYAIAFTQNNWKPAQIDIIRIPITDGQTPDFENVQRTRRVKSMLKTTDDFIYALGIGVTANTESAGAKDPDGYIYFYGYRDNLNAFSQKDLIVGRIHESELSDMGKMRYWDGSDWCDDIEQSAILIERVSCEASVSYINAGPYKGKYIAVYTQDTQSSHIMYAIGDSLTGPFDTPVECYTAPETATAAVGGDGTIYTYNAKAHPHISPAGTLLISYNVNVNRNGCAENTADYRPRFLSLDLGATPEEIAALTGGDPDGGSTDNELTYGDNADTSLNDTGKNEKHSFPTAAVIGIGSAIAVIGGACIATVAVKKSKKGKDRQK